MMRENTIKNYEISNHLSFNFSKSNTGVISFGDVGSQPGNPPAGRPDLTEGKRSRKRGVLRSGGLAESLFGSRNRHR
jgi:hypothetical protein